MSDRGDVHDEFVLRGMDMLPREWGAWSGLERELWHEREALGRQEDAALEAVRAALPEALQGLVTTFDTAKEDMHLCAINLVFARLLRYRPDLADLIRFAFDRVGNGMIQEDLAPYPNPLMVVG